MATPESHKTKCSNYEDFHSLLCKDNIESEFESELYSLDKYMAQL